MTDPTIRKQRELEARQRRERWQQAEREAQRRKALSRPPPRVPDGQERLARIEREWGAFKASATQAIREQHKAAHWQEMQGLMDGLTRMTNPPPPAALPPPPAEVYQGSSRLGSPDFNPALFSAPMRWW